MSDAHLGLQRYEGRYLTHWGWHDGKDISRYLNVTVTGDHLTAQTESVTYPVEVGFLPIDDPAVERERGEVRPLRAAAEHTFDVVGYPRSYRFVLQDADTARSLVVIRDGEPSEPCPRFVPLPDEVPGRRERGEWFDLGQPALCMMARDVPALKDFYERLGFATRSAAPDLERVSTTDAVALCSYTARELDTETGESLVIHTELNEWLWAENERGESGWVPKNTVA